MTLFNEILPEFDRFNAQVLGISVDNVWCHLAFSKYLYDEDSHCCQIFILKEMSGTSVWSIQGMKMAYQSVRYL